MCTVSASVRRGKGAERFARPLAVMLVVLVAGCDLTTLTAHSSAGLFRRALLSGVLRIHEAAAFTALYVLVTSLFVYRELGVRDVPV